MPLQPTLLSIAGSDPSGGAGIQADLKTMTTTGVYGAAALTCLTVQNAKGVQEIYPLPEDFVAAQIRAVLEDHDVTHIKIGMTGSETIIHCLSRLLDPFTGEVIYDPVLASTTGERLFADNTLAALQTELLPWVSYLTPNRDELQLLSNQAIGTTHDAIDAAEFVLKHYPLMKGIIVKGGHIDESELTISDFLVRPDTAVVESKRRRLDNPNLHGTGCTYASAFASYLCLGNTSAAAFRMAGDYMDQIIRAGIDKSASLSPGNGPLLHFLM